jgi:hypothetical protein
MSGVKSLIVTIGTAVSALALAGLVVIQVLSWRESRDELAQLRKELREPRYEYKVIDVSSEGQDRTGEAAMKYTSVTPKQEELSKLGAEGWEVVASYLEMETAFPNFGNAGYVTGLQPNIRPQRAVLILRRRIG